MDYFKIGNEWFEKNNYQKAVKNYLIELESTPSNIEILLKLSQAYYELKEFRPALTSIEVIIEQDPENIEALKIKGNCSLELCLLYQAEKVFSDLINLNPTIPEYYLKRGESRKLMGKEDGYKEDLAKSEFSKLEILDPIFSYETIEKLGDLDMEEFTRTQQKFLKMIILNSNNYDAYYELGVAFDNIYAFKSASNAYSNAISLYNDGLLEKALFKRARAYYNNREYKEALLDIEKYLTIYPQDNVMLELKENITSKDSLK